MPAAIVIARTSVLMKLCSGLMAASAPFQWRSPLPALVQRVIDRLGQFAGLGVAVEFPDHHTTELLCLDVGGLGLLRLDIVVAPEDLAGRVVQVGVLRIGVEVAVVLSGAILAAQG